MGRPIPGTDAAKAIESYRKAREALGLIPNRRKALETTIKAIEDKMGGLQPPTSH
jgi:hypothetical protein